MGKYTGLIIKIKGIEFELQGIVQERLLRKTEPIGYILRPVEKPKKDNK